MARSPFQGTWQDGVRPTVVTAPDAIVYINGQPDLLGCNSCRRRFDLNKYITSVQVDLNVYNAPGSASINLSLPRHMVDTFYVEGEPIISPMMEVEIYAKGYYLVEGLPQYYPIFWGLVTEVSDSYSGGEHTFSINCADILKWWELCKLNTNPAFTQAAGQLGANYVTGNVFNGMSAYDVIWTLAQQSMGDIVQATGSLNSVVREPAGIKPIRQDIMNYWNFRFGQMRSNLLLYGVQGGAVRGDILYASHPTKRAQKGSRWVSKAIRDANGGDNTSQLLFDPNTITPFRSDIANAGSPNFWQSEHQTKLELANVCKEAVGFEFYMDVTGDIVFKPPFFNLDILSNKPISWIQDIDIIDWDFSESESEVVTHLQMQGSYEGGAMSYGVTNELTTPYSQVVDYHLLRRYGVRTQTYNAEFLSNDRAMFLAGVDILDKINSKRHRATINIPMRSELRLGFPVYVAPKDQIWYVTGISHNLQHGGRAQTSLTLTAKRSKFIAPQGIGTLELTGFRGSTSQKQKSASGTVETSTPLQNTTSAKTLSSTGQFNLNVGAASQIPPVNSTEGSSADDPYAPLILRHPKTGRVVGYPNVTMAYTRPFKPTAAESKKLQGQNLTAKRKAKKVRDQNAGTAADDNQALVDEGYVQTADRDLIDKHLTNRYVYGMTTAGVYTYVHDVKRTIQELVLLPARNIDVTIEGQTVASKAVVGTTATIRPVSDERGFELVGHYRYGRGVSLRDGSLVLSSNNGVNQRASIDTQLALGGGLFQTLTAQSAGLTLLSTSYSSPADTISRLAPEDLQTAARLNPETREPEFSPLETNFVDVAPLGSPANKGIVVNVEASQLSKALTLAEMSVKDGTIPNEECYCLLGRSDLAFINVGYQVQFMPGAEPDNTDLEASATGTGSDLASLRASLDSLQLDLEAADLTNDLGIIVDAEDLAYKPVVDKTFSRSRAETISKVDDFLTKLYRTLDEPHQQYESVIRGKLTETPNRQEALFTATSQNSGVPGSQTSNQFAPPFSVSNRARGGDPRALALQANTASGDMGRAWKQFGDDLRRKPRQENLEEQIKLLDSKLQDLDVEEARLEKALETGSTIIGLQGGIGSRLANLQSERAKLSEDRANAGAKLHQLQNESN